MNLEKINVINGEQIEVLDLCCAPGAKYNYIADILEENYKERKFRLTGVDINENRINICKSITNKYNHKSDINRIYDIICCDGRSFKSNFEFDRVIVDAECTHEGSIKHLIKWFSDKNHVKMNMNKKGEKIERKKEEKMIENRFLEKERLKGMSELQYELLKNGFNLLKEGGELVYSTCSLARVQNEGVVERLLMEQQGRAKLVKINIDGQELQHHQHSIINGQLHHTIMFHPIHSQCGAMFIAKITKILNHNHHNIINHLHQFQDHDIQNITHNHKDKDSYQQL